MAKKAVSKKTTSKSSRPKIRVKPPKNPAETPPPDSAPVTTPTPRSTSPMWECEAGPLPEGSTQSSQPSEPAASQRQARNARSPRWDSWQDRFLVIEVDVVRPFNASNAKMVAEAWEKVANNLHQHMSPQAMVDRTGPACRARFEKLVQAHKNNETRSLQLTGTDEQVNDHIELLTGLVELHDARAMLKGEISAKKKEKLTLEAQASLELREASMKGLIHRESLIDVSVLPDASVREKQSQRGNKRRAISVSTPEKENVAPPRKRRHSQAAELISQQIVSDKKTLQELQELDKSRHEELTNQNRQVIGILERVSSLMEAQQRREMEHQEAEMKHARQQSDQLSSLTSAILGLSVNIGRDGH